MNYPRFVHFLLVACVLGWSAPAKVFILSGQSNMVGRGKVSELPVAWQSPISNVQLFAPPVGGDPTWTTWQTLVPGSGAGDDPSDFRFGPELGIGKTLSGRFPNERVYLIKAGWGGVPLHGGWLDPSKSYYSWMLTSIRAGLNAMTRAGITYTIAGMIWMQGESDAIVTSEVAQAYSTNLSIFVAKVRADLQTPTMPFVYGMIHNDPAPVNSGGQAWTWLFGKQVQTQQFEAQFTIPNVRCTDGPMKESVFSYETTHYNTTGTINVGLQLGQAVVEKLDGKTNPGCRNPWPIVDRAYTPSW